MKKLTAEIARRDISNMRLYLENGNRALSFKDELYLQALEIALPVLEQQEKGGSDWIQWHGGECPVPEKTIVIVRYRKGKEESPGDARGYFWHHHYGTVDIIAYRVVEQERERGEEK